MSDDERGTGPSGGGDEDINLPKATVAKLVQELLPKDFTCSKEAKDLMAECCKEFVLAIASEANEICEKDSKKTMLPEHILAALKALGFDSYVEDVSQQLTTTKEQVKGDRERKASRANGSGLSQEELLLVQERMFAEARAKMEAGGGAPVEG